MRKDIWIMILLVIPAMLMPGQFARGQGLEDYLLPPEIKIKYLDQYAYRLDLSLAQWVAVLDLHQGYKKQYKELRVEEIEPWLKNRIDRSTWTFAAWLKVLDKYNDKVNFFRRRMAAIDNDLFLNIESILMERQLERMPGVRSHRRRQFAYYYWGDIPRESWNRGVLELSDIVLALSLTRTEEEAIDPILTEYERRLTPLCDQATKICIDWYAIQFRELVKRGLGEQEVGNSPIWNQVVHDIWFMPKGRSLVRLGTQIDKLTHNTAKSIEQAFVDERREEWLDAYVKKAYPRYASIRTYRRRVAESIESITHLSDEEEAYLVASFEEYERRMRDLLDRNMAASDGYWIPRPRGTGEEHSDRWDKARAVWNARGKELFAIRDWFSSQLEQGLGTAAFTQWDETHTQLSTRPDWRPQHSSGRRVRMIYDSPMCLSSPDVDQVLGRFDLEDETRATVNTLVETYRSECYTIRAEQMEATKTWDGPLEAQYIERNLQRDARLIAALQQSLESEEASRMLEWLMPIRQRQLYSRNLHRGGEVDPITFLLDAEISTEQLLELAPQIDAYNLEVNPIYQQRYDSVVRYRRENPGENSNNAQTDTLNRRMSVINDRAMRSMTVDLPELLGNGLLNTFLRTSHHYAYKDPGQLHQVFQRPSLREAITSDQRQQLDDLHADYISLYAELTTAMVALCIDADYWTSGRHGVPFNVPSRSIEGIGNIIAEYAPLHIQRDDLNAETNVRIRYILTPQQVRAIGGLPDLD